MSPPSDPNRMAVVYARCSTNRDQKPEVQIDEMRRYCAARGWSIAYEITDSGHTGTTDKRPGLQQLLAHVRSRKVDVVVVLKLDRLFRSLKHLVTSLEEFSQLGVEFISVKDQIDLTTSTGRLMIQIIGAFAEFEANLIKERTMLGLDYAVSKGKKLGRPPEYDADKIRRLRNEGHSFRQIQRELGCSSGVISRAIRPALKSVQKAEQKTQVETRVANG